MVENYTVTTTNTSSTIDVGGIVGDGFANITNCHIKNMQVNNCGNLFGISRLGNVETSVVQNLTYTSANYYNAITSTSGSNSNCYTTNEGDDFEKLSSINSTGGTSGTTWYFAYNHYNSGWPMLRSFIKWNKIKFKGAGVKFADLKNEIYVPVEISLPTWTEGEKRYDNLSSEEFIFELCNQIIYGQQAYKCDEFEYWVLESIEENERQEKIYNFEIISKVKTFILTFKDCDGTTNNANDFYEIKCATWIQVNKINAEKIEFIFKDSAGNECVVTYEINNSINTQYFIKKANINSCTMHKHDEKFPKEIEVVLELKSYDIIFG